LIFGKLGPFSHLMGGDPRVLVRRPGKFSVPGFSTWGRAGLPEQVLTSRGKQPQPGPNGRLPSNARVRQQPPRLPKTWLFAVAVADGRGTDFCCCSCFPLASQLGVGLYDCSGAFFFPNLNSGAGGGKFPIVFRGGVRGRAPNQGNRVPWVPGPNLLGFHAKGGGPWRALLFVRGKISRPRVAWGQGIGVFFSWGGRRQGFYPLAELSGLWIFAGPILQSFGPVVA